MRAVDFVNVAADPQDVKVCHFSERSPPKIHFENSAFENDNTNSIQNFNEEQR